jgi:T5SS/PEP-CTERM-associated repeat protein
LTADNFYLGAEGSGSLNVSSYGTVSNRFGFLAYGAESQASATVVGGEARWTNTAALTVGYLGRASMFINDGGYVSSADGFLAFGEGSVANVTVSGPGSLWSMSGQLAMGGNPTSGVTGGGGTLRIEDGGTVSVARETVLFPEGALHLDGGTLDTAAVMFQGGGLFNWTSGTLHVDAFHGHLTNRAGILAPGDSAGDTTILGNYTQQSGGTLEIEIGGVGMGSQYDFVNVNGNALLDGQLDLKLINHFMPGPSQTYTIFNAGSLQGFFDNAGNGQRVTTLDGRGSFLINYGLASPFNPNQIVLSAFRESAGLAGDYNEDGTVNAADYVVWRNNVGRPNSLPNDHTPGVGDDDYQRWTLNFGLTAGSGAHNSQAVPEPAAVFLLAMSLGCSTARRWVVCESGAS